ncbi:hypothetical protein PRIEUP_LOCUS1945, partial [Pristimantis euphronides]
MVLEARRAQILAGSGPFREKLINDDRFRGYPAEIAQGSSEEEEEDVSEDVPLGTLQCSEGVSGGPPDGQDYPLPASSDEEEVPASVGGLVLQQIRLLESPIDPQSFSFGDDFLEEDSGVSGKVRSAKSKKRQKGQVIEKLAFRYSSPGSASEPDRGAGRSSAGPVAPQNAAQHVGMASGTGTTGGGGGGTAAHPQEAGGGVATVSESPQMGRGLWRLNSSLLEEAEVRQSFEDFLQSQVPLLDLCSSKSEWWEIFKKRAAGFLRGVSSLRSLNRYRLYQGLRRKLEHLVSTGGVPEDVSRVKSLLKKCQYDRHASLVFERDFGKYR